MSIAMSHCGDLDLGLTFNGLRLMEMAASGDPSISITGDVELHIGSFLARSVSV